MKRVAFAFLLHQWVLLALMLGGCASTKVFNEGHFEVTTNYWNFKPRTSFQMKDGALANEVILYDKQGSTKLKYPVQENLDYWALNYRNIADSNKTERDYLKFNKGINDFANHVGMNYRPMFEKGEYDVSFTILLWLNEKGKAEHSICVQNFKCPPEVIKSVIEEAESWQFPPEKGTKLKVFPRTFNFHVSHHTDFSR